MAVAVKEIQEVKISLLPKQLLFVNSEAKEVLYSGAFGAGKTRALCFKVAKHASIPGNLVGLCRKTFFSMKQSTLRTLLNPDGNLPPVLPEGSYKHYKSDHIIALHGAGEIYYFGFDNPERVASLNLGAVGVDEGIEIDPDEYIMLLGRLRNPVDLIRQIFIATNPGSPSHFLYQRFFEKKHPDREVIETNSLENFFLPADYLMRLKGFSGQNRARYMEGKWVAFEGLIYDMWDRKVFCAERDEEWKEVIAGIDEGFTHPAVILVAGLDNDGRMHQFQEFYQTGIRPERFVETACAYAKRFGVEIFFCDPSAAGLIADLKAKGLNAVAADNAVMEGIRRVQKRLTVAGDGRPRYTIDPARCPNTVKEIEAYRWRDSKIKEEPVKEFDDAMDAWRYLVAGVNTRVRPRIISLADVPREAETLAEAERKFNEGFGKSKETQRAMDEVDPFEDNEMWK